METATGGDGGRRALGWPTAAEAARRALRLVSAAGAPPAGGTRELGRPGLAVERAHVLAWALELAGEPPPFDRESDPARVARLFPEPPEPVEPFVAGCRLRPVLELDVMREIAERWIWRADVALAERASSVASPSLRRVVTRVAEEMRSLGWLPHLADGDFPVAGRPYAAIGAERAKALRDLASARRSELGWLGGG